MSTETESKGESSKGARVPVWLLVTITACLLAGMVFGVAVTNALDRESIALSTADLISFVFTVALGGASLILAAITIVLSAQAQDALTRRSDEGIRLQNEAFTRTTEVLAAIRTSTGVTERRIEDIISGTSLIAQETLVNASHKRGRISDDEMQKIKDDLESRLKAELLPIFQEDREPNDYLREMAHRRDRLNEMRMRWRAYREAIEARLIEHGAQVVCTGPGHFDSSSMEDFWDGVYELNGKRVALEIHTAEQALSQDSDWARNMLSVDSIQDQYVAPMLLRAMQDHVDFVVMPWDTADGIEEYVEAQRAALAVEEYPFTALVPIGDPASIAEQVIAQVH